MSNFENKMKANCKTEAGCHLMANGQMVIVY